MSNDVFYVKLSRGDLEKIKETQKEIGILDVVSDVDALRAENERLKAALEWQPIETAPKDGTAFLVKVPQIKSIFFMARYSTTHKQFLSGHDSEDGISILTRFAKGDLWRHIDAPEKGGE